MVLDFAALPPEINSALMYTGAGSGPLMAAATAWSNLAAELSVTATQYESIITTLTTEQWTGLGSLAAAAAAKPYVSWLGTTAAAAEQAAAQASSSAASYEAAFTATVPPPLIAANRSLLATLVATNFMGINTPAIMATEAHYAEMWVQDATAMYTYAASAAASSVLQPLTPATPTTNPAGTGLQAAAVAQSQASTPVQSLSSVISGLQSALGSAAGGVQPIGLPIWNAFQAAFPNAAAFVSSLDGLGGTLFNFNFVQQVGVTAAWWVGNTIPTAVSLGHTLGAAAPVAAASDVVPVAGGVLGAEGTLVNAAMPAGLGGAMTAGLGGASAVGSLSVPASWSSAAPATLASSTAPLEGSGWTAATDEAGGGPVGGMMPGMAAAGKGAGAMAGPRYGFKPIVMPKQVVV